MKDIGLGILDPYTVVIVLVTIVLAQVLFGYQIPLDTSNATQLLFGLVIYTGYIYFVRSIVRFPVALIKSWWYFRESVMFPLSLSFAHTYGFLGWLRKAIRTVILTPLILLDLSLISLSFGSPEFDEAYPSQKFNKLKERVWLFYFFGLLDRLSTVVIASLMVFPTWQERVNTLGIVGIIFIIVLFLFKGNFAALLADSLDPQKNSIKIEKKKEFRIYSDEPSHEIAHRFGKHPIKITHCTICGKACSENENGWIPRTCSLACSQKWSSSWDKDWCIGDGEERELLNSLRQTGYRDESEVEKVVDTYVSLYMSENPPKLQPVWALLGIVRDCDGWIAGYRLHEIQRYVAKAFGNLNKTADLFGVLSKSLLDESTRVSDFSAEMLAKYQKDWIKVDTSKIEPLFYNSKREIRLAAIQMLGRGKQFDKLVALFDKKDSFDRQEAAKTLAALGESAIPALRKARKSKNAQINACASMVLHAIVNGRTDPTELSRGELLCSKCHEVLTINIPERLMISGLKSKSTFGWFFAKNKLKTKCPSCQSNTYVILLEQEEWIQTIRSISKVQHPRNTKDTEYF